MELKILLSYLFTLLYSPLVLQAVEDPEPGFPTALTGALGLFILNAAGVLKTIYVTPDIRLDLSPQDLVTKTLLYYIFRTFKSYELDKQPKEIEIFHMSSSTHSDITLPQFNVVVNKYKIFEDLTFEKNFLIPGVFVTNSRFAYMFMVSWGYY